MSTQAGARPYLGIVGGARVFVLLFLMLAVVWSRNTPSTLSMLAIATIWGLATLVSRLPGPLLWLGLTESLLVGLICANPQIGASPLLAALTVPPFVYGLWRGIRGVLESLAGELVGIAAMALIFSTPHAEHLTALVTWMFAGLGIGALASFVDAVSKRSQDPAAPYREARDLLQELVNLSSRLAGGLDPTSMAGSILDEVGTQVPLQNADLHVPRDGELHRLAMRSQGDVAPEDEESRSLVTSAWHGNKVQLVGHAFAFPLTIRGAPIAVVSGTLVSSRDPELLRTTEQLNALSQSLESQALRLDAAQLFAEFRDAATADERSRLAREMHDGVAQEIASMGYVVDALVAAATVPEQRKALEQLRTMITGVVGEIRQSVTTLRTQAGSSESLGEAIARLARHLSQVSGTPIQVHVDERTSRLRHEVEAELLRIAQEAMNNAVKHANATLIHVHCMVDAPRAEIRVTDDGGGISGGRTDSYGLKIMRERASLIGAELEISTEAGQGTVVSVTLGTARPAKPLTTPLVSPLGAS